MADRLVLYAVDDKVQHHTLNRPEKLKRDQRRSFSRQLTEGIRPGRCRPRDQRRAVARPKARSLLRPVTEHLGKRAGGRRLGVKTRPKAHDHLRPQLEFRDDAVDDEEARSSPRCRVTSWAGGCEPRDAVRSDDRRRQCRAWARPEVRFFQRRAGDRDADDHRLQEGRGNCSISGDTIDCPDRNSHSGMGQPAWCRLPSCARASLRWAKAAFPDFPRKRFMRPSAPSTGGADAAGFRTAIYAGLDVVGPLYTATKRPNSARSFREMVAFRGRPRRRQVASGRNFKE